MNDLRRQKIIIAVLVGMLLAAGVVIFWQWRSQRSSDNPAGDFLPWREKQSEYPLINPLLGCQFAEETAAASLAPLKRSVAATIAANSSVSDAAFYFRRLASGAWTGIDENRGFDPASLLKEPLMIAYLRYSERYSGVLDKTLIWSSNDYNSNQNIRPPKTIVIGRPYTVAQLIEAMIVNSDNNAFLALYHNIYPKFLVDVYNELGLVVSADNQVNTISPKQYSLFFRILYNASYLDRENSEYALDVLSHSSFQDGIAKPLPRSILIAHKFGERSKGAGDKELHDCGIIFYDNDPYILCVMTRGTDFKSLEDLIQKISAEVFEYVSGGKLK
jgi:beta-lactamase class A